MAPLFETSDHPCNIAALTVICPVMCTVILTGPLPNADNFLLVADESLRNIYQVDATSGATAQLLPFGAARKPTALAFDSTAMILYWTDVHVSTINRYSLLTNSSIEIYRDTSYVGKYDR